ncbi:DUF3995 domain-containing protein [Actinocorallia sp. B10E7]|uniref:DUF3995 domain-containing protein n=1 Tax=Actinocorallia sp. B10E7 TaxID=3153558 RepID=UPI00325C5976
MRLRGVLPGSWSGYAAAGCAFVFAVPSFYWGFGGEFGADTIGRWAVDLSWRDDPPAMAAVLLTGCLKVLGGLLALALVRPAWPRPPRWMMLTAGYGAAALLVSYGGIYELLQALVAVRAIEVPADFDWYAFWWHLYLWSPWFLVWGILLGLAALHYQSSTAGRGHASATA